MSMYYAHPSIKCAVCPWPYTIDQPIEYQQHSYEVFEKKHGMECTTAFSGPVWRSKRCWRRMWVWHVLFACIGAGCLTSSRGRHLQGSGLVLQGCFYPGRTIARRVEKIT